MHGLQRVTLPLPGCLTFNREVKQFRPRNHPRFHCRAAQSILDSDRRPREWGQSVPISAVVYQGSKGNPQTMRQIYFATGNQNKLKEVSWQETAVVTRASLMLKAMSCCRLLQSWRLGSRCRSSCARQRLISQSCRCAAWSRCSLCGSSTALCCAPGTLLMAVCSALLLCADTSAGMQMSLLCFMLLGCTEQS